MGGRGSGGGRSGGGGASASKELSNRIKAITNQFENDKNDKNVYIFYKNLSTSDLKEAVRISKNNYNRINKKFVDLEATGISHFNKTLDNLQSKSYSAYWNYKHAESALKNRTNNNS